MVVMTQDRSAVYDSGNVVLTAARETGGVTAIFADLKTAQVAKYDSRREAKAALEMYMAAAAAGEKYFEFPPAVKSTKQRDTVDRVLEKLEDMEAAALSMDGVLPTYKLDEVIALIKTIRERVTG